MRVLQVVHGFPPKQRAGTEIYTYYLSKELAKNHEVHVLYPKLEHVKKPTFLSFNRENLVLHELKYPTSRMQRFINMLFFENTYINKEIEDLFRTLITDIDPNIIHFEHLIGLSSTFIEIAGELKIPTVITLHDYWFICPNIQLLKYDYTICNGPKANKCHKCWIKKHSKTLSEALNKYYIPEFLTLKPFETILKFLNSMKKFEKRIEYMKSILLKVDKIIAPSQFLREIFIKYGIPQDKIIYSENGYNLDIFKGFRKKKKNTDKVIFGFAGGITRHKGIHVLIDAFINVPEDKAELRIYGNYDLNSKYIKELLEKIKGKRNIKLMGRFEDVKIPYSEIDILIVPSIWHETGGPLVVREALATRTPVVASRVGSIPELIINNFNGLLFEPGDSKDLYDKIMQIIENPDLIEKFKQNIKPPRDIKEQAKEIEKIYYSILEMR